MFDALSFIIGFIIGASTTIWIAGIGIYTERVQNKIKKNYEIATNMLGQVKKAQIIHKTDEIDNLIQS